VILTAADLSRTIRQRPWSAAVVGVAVAVALWAAARVVLTLAGSFDLGFGLMLVLPVALEMGLIVFGLVLVARGLPYRTGESLHCAKCGYQRVEERDRLLINCPECGHYWRMFGGWREGRPQGNRRLVRVGGLVILAGLATLSMRGFAARWLTERMSTSMLIRNVLFAPADDARLSWEVLARRSLTSSQSRWLAEDLLRRRMTRGVLDVRSAAWLDQRVASPSFDRELTSRYFEEAADVWIDAPDQVNAGDMFEATLKAVYRGPSGPTPEGPLTLAVEGITIELPGISGEDARTAFEKSAFSAPTIVPPQGVSVRTMDAREARRFSALSAANASPRFVGKAKVKAVVWILAGPEIGEDLQWRSGQPPLTLSGQKRAIRREIIREVDVVLPRN
jgi:hypothetical protein